jgi:hypothetical protein
VASLLNGAEVAGLVRRPYWIDLVPYRASGNTFIGFAQQTQEMFDLANIGGLASEDCALAYASDPWKCALGVYRMPFLKTPYMMVASQADAFQINGNIGRSAIPMTPQELAYAQKLAVYTRGNASHLIAPGTVPAADGSTVFSMNCHSHSTSLSDHGMSGMNVGGWRMMDALASFIGLSQRPLPVGGLFDPSEGFGTGEGCDNPGNGPHVESDCGTFCGDHHLLPDECGCNVCGSHGDCTFSCTADNRTRFECRPTAVVQVAAQSDGMSPSRRRWTLWFAGLCACSFGSVVALNAERASGRCGRRW